MIEDREKEGINPIDQAVIKGIEVLREINDIELSPQHIIDRYLDKERIILESQRILESEEFQNLPYEERGLFLYKQMLRYVIMNKPFDERGKRFFDRDLEGIVGEENFLRRIFSTRRGRNERAIRGLERNLGSRKTAEEIFYAVAENPEFYYKEAPELFKAVSDLERTTGRGKITDILRSGGYLSKRYYDFLKETAKEVSERILDLAEQYVEKPIKLTKEYVQKPATSYVTAIIGIGLIFLFNPITTTGAVIGIESSVKSPGLFFVGIGLLLISGLSFIFRRKNSGKKKKK